MADTISFDKAVYDPGERMTISYECALRTFRGVRLIDVNGVILLDIRDALTGKGFQVYTLREDAPAGMYKAELTYYRGTVVKASATAEVTGVGVPPAEKGYLTVNTTPTGATVTVDGVSCGLTPVSACELSTGSKTVTIAKSGYNTESRAVTITAGQTSNLDTITLTAAPPVDEGITKELDLGEYEVTWTLSGYGALKAEITVTDTGVTCLSVTGGACYSATPPGVTISTFTVTGYLKSAIAPTRGYLSVNTSPTGALVTVDIVFPCGTTPVTECELDTGTKTVKITKSGYNTVTRSVTITAGATTNLGTITLTPTGVPSVEIGSWIDESGVTNLTPSHAMYVYYLSQGATGAADTKYAGLSPKPSRMDPSIATVDNAMGIFYYSQGAMGAGNAKTGCNY